MRLSHSWLNQQRTIGGWFYPHDQDPDGVTFHDGTPFNAEAAKWNLDRKINEKLPLADEIPFESITAPDATTLVIKLTRPYPPLYGYLSTKTFSMYSPTFVDKVGADGTQESGSGYRTVYGIGICPQ